MIQHPASEETMQNEIIYFTAADGNDSDGSDSDVSLLPYAATEIPIAREQHPAVVRNNKRYLQFVFLILLCLSLSLADYESLPRRLEHERSKLKRSKPPQQTNETAAPSPISSCARNILIINNNNFNTKNTTTSHNNKPNHRLELLHIPKTAGSTLEQQAAAVGITWGACHWLPEKYNCPPHPKRSSLHHPELKVSFWHLPPQQLQGYYSPYDDDKVDLFVVVRNPYSRIVSQWNYLFDMPWPTPAALKHQHKSNATQMNAFLHKVLPALRNQTSQDDYYAYDGHFVPQIDFVKATADDSRNHSSADSAVVAVLHQETLHRDFACLMELYQLNITLPEAPRPKSANSSNTGSSSLNVTISSSPRSSGNGSADKFVHKQGSLTVRDLTEETRQLIADVYRQDFEVFGYEM